MTDREKQELQSFHAMTDELSKRRCDRILMAMTDSIKIRSGGDIDGGMAAKIAKGLIQDLDWSDIAVIARTELSRRYR